MISRTWMARVPSEKRPRKPSHSSTEGFCLTGTPWHIRNSGPSPSPLAGIPQEGFEQLPCLCRVAAVGILFEIAPETVNGLALPGASKTQVIDAFLGAQLIVAFRPQSQAPP
jgi:hypothetical protein